MLKIEEALVIVKNTRSKAYCQHCKKQGYLKDRYFFLYLEKRPPLHNPLKGVLLFSLLLKRSIEDLEAAIKAILAKKQKKELHVIKKLKRRRRLKLI